MTGNFAALWSAMQHHDAGDYLRLGAPLSRISRSSVLKCVRIMSQPRGRREKLSEKTVIWRHILPVRYHHRHHPWSSVRRVAQRFINHRNCFSYPGIGDLLASPFQRDYKLTQILILMFAVTYFAVNLLVDLLYSWIDPRIKY
jgi:ABC-type dipeptide/oligopeptide/nickel transport system permease component